MLIRAKVCPQQK
ncbi:hypothetical protein F383_19636 [Gossypium arboreum]|uniref:Uncharacterized protein n=1 Tax=Gossypium arboreum TaxID=29729 RepID=A0A0B0NPX9_GOSAR|nr:hypothetical protein F383_19636 [Gossypium arboreum]